MAANGDRGSFAGAGLRTARISGDGYILKIQNCTVSNGGFHGM